MLQTPAYGDRYSSGSDSHVTPFGAPQPSASGSIGLDAGFAARTSPLAGREAGASGGGGGGGGGTTNVMQPSPRPAGTYNYPPASSTQYNTTHAAPPPSLPLAHHHQDARPSPQSHLYAAPHPHQFEQPAAKQYPMAAPGTPTNQQPVAGVNNALPMSPGSQNREQQRIELLLEINVELLREVSRLQQEGQGGALSSQQVAQLRSEGKPDQVASEDYIQCLRRVQANLAYLMPKAQADPNVQAKASPGPAHMTPPPQMPHLQAKYDQLRELFPGWVGLDYRAAASSASPRPNGPNATNGMTAPPASAQT